MRQKYLEHLSEIVKYDGQNPRPRVRHPAKWHNINSVSKTNDFINLETTKKTIWIWSDHHFRHNRVIAMCNRPYRDMDEMISSFVDNFNNTVNAGDICIWGGDVTFKGNIHFNEEIMPLFKKCYNIQVVGNHDFNNKNPRNLNFDERHLLLDLNLKSKKVVISHYPFGKPNDGFINVHGHIHGYDSEYLHQINVCVEKTNYKPIKLLDLI
jgi:calcineurin-like phosphoesterase family protein